MGRMIVTALVLLAAMGGCEKKKPPAPPPTQCEQLSKVLMTKECNAGTPEAKDACMAMVMGSTTAVDEKDERKCTLFLDQLAKLH